MTRKKLSADYERELLLGMIVSTDFLKGVILILDNKLLQNRYSRIIGTWCVEHFTKYGEAPVGEIQNRFESEELGEEAREYIEKLLSHLSKYAERQKEFNWQYRLDQTEQYLKRQKISQLTQQLNGDIDKGDTVKAENRIATFKRVERVMGEAVDVFKDRDAIIEALRSKKETMMELSGDLGGLLGPFYRGDLVGVAAPMKRGKSWWLQYLGECALNLGYKVLFISCEMTKEQCLYRFVQSYTGRGIKDKIVNVPFFTQGKDGYRVNSFKKEVTIPTIEEWDDAIKVFTHLNNGSQYKVLTFPQDTLTVADLYQHLENLEFYSDFLPDVIVVDYADILAPERDSPREYRHRLDHTWKKLRGLAQELNCLVLTGTQSSRGSLSRDGRPDDVSEDVRKLAHVSKMFCLNRSDVDKSLGLMRVGMWVERHDTMIESDEVVVTQCLDVGKPVLDSQWKSKIIGVYDDSKRKGHERGFEES